jgi:hypothetical protein
MWSDKDGAIKILSHLAKEYAVMVNVRVKIVERCRMQVLITKNNL